jgi:hypothetical protein
VSFTPIGPRGDYHLQTTSPGQNIAPDPGIAQANTDYDGQARVFPADTGADEFYPPPTLTFGDLKLFGPTAAEVVRTGTTQNLSWQAPATFPAGVTYKLQVSYDNGANWKVIDGAEALTGTTFSWKVPPRNSNAKQSLIRIQAFDGNTKLAQDASQPFEVEVVKVVYPSDARVEIFGGLTLSPPYGINWRLNDVKTQVAKVRIDVSKDGGATWIKADLGLDANPILSPAEGQEYQQTWTVPTAGKEKKKAKIRVTLYDKAGNIISKDQNDVFFTILPEQ